MLESSLLKISQKTCTELKSFRLFFLKNDENCYVEVEDVEEIDLTKIIERLERGESIFISPRCKQESNQKMLVKKFSTENATKPWYFTHI